MIPQRRRQVWLILVVLILFATIKVPELRRKWSRYRDRESRCTLLSMSYAPRAALLRGFVEHYTQCKSSVGEILIVWNGAGVEAIADLAFPDDSSGPKIRIRVEHEPSMNNRYKPDPKIAYRGVLSLDDDLRIPCESIDKAFSLWKQKSGHLVGWFPRLVESPEHDHGNSGFYHGEPEAIEQGRYNLILSGAAFLDNRRYFEKYWAEELEPLRAIVNEKLNCDDILMNFVVAYSHSQSSSLPVVQYLRPDSLVDLSHSSGVGISHNEDKFIAAANECIGHFIHFFGNPLRVNTFPEWNAAAPKPICNPSRSRLFCLYPKESNEKNLFVTNKQTNVMA